VTRPWIPQEPSMRCVRGGGPCCVVAQEAAGARRPATGRHIRRLRSSRDGEPSVTVRPRGRYIAWRSPHYRNR